VREPDDLLGEVFLQVVRKLPQFDGDERQFKAWVLTIAHHRVVDDARRRTRRPVEPASGDAPEAAGPIANSEDESLGRLATGEVCALIDKLSLDQRDVLLLRIVGGLTVTEVAHALGKRQGAVKALQARGLAAIRKEMSTRGVTLSATTAFT
jgi:RNA polymerase sigma factor (sigma-70 family)